MAAATIEMEARNKADDGTSRQRNPAPLAPCRMMPGGAAGTCRRLARHVRSAIEEALWSTRCVVCDMPGAVVCDDCLLRLPYVDRWRCCPRCGAPNGIAACVDCNSFTLGEIGRSEPPFRQCLNVVEHIGAAQAIVTGYKDAGERRVGGVMARMMARVVPRSWWREGPQVAYVPADRRALRRRGFDHMALIADAFCAESGAACAKLIVKEPVADQRGLSRRERFENMAGAIRIAPDAPEDPPESVLLLDDVHTTGATLYAACDALASWGVGRIRCLTFARVP